MRDTEVVEVLLQERLKQEQRKMLAMAIGVVRCFIEATLKHS